MKLTSILSVFALSLCLMACSSNDPDKFIGTWTGDINCGGEVDPFSMTVTLGASDDQLLIDFEDSPLINATIDGDNITIEKTSIPDGGGDSSELSGSGTINDNGELVMTFVVDFLEDGVFETTQTCTVVLAK